MGGFSKKVVDAALARKTAPLPFIKRIYVRDFPGAWTLLQDMRVWGGDFEVQILLLKKLFLLLLKKLSPRNVSWTKVQYNIPFPGTVRVSFV